MDGRLYAPTARNSAFPAPMLAQPPATIERTLKSAIGCVGVGLHSGRKVTMNLHPAASGTGIVFRRTDVAGSRDIPARFANVIDTRLCTVVAHPDQPLVGVGTIEHLMAAFVGCGVQNALVTVDGPELPILDGSAASFLFLIDCAGTVEQSHNAAVIEILRTVRVTKGEAFAELRPSYMPGFEARLSIAFDAAAIGSQSIQMRLTPETFRAELARARTFTHASEVAQLQAQGLARGGSLANAIVVDGDTVLNPGGLRMEGEFVRHKLLDAVGDLALAGAALQGILVAHRPGHALNNRLLHALFADDANWRPMRQEITVGAAPAMAGWQDAHMAAAASPF